jgi:hypothetical protein
VLRAVLVGMLWEAEPLDASAGGRPIQPERVLAEHIDAMTQEDPGWRPSLRGFPWYLIPFFDFFDEVRRARGRRRERNGLIDLRSKFLGVLFPLFLFLWAMRFIAPWDGGDERWVPWAVAAMGVYTLAAIAWFRRRPLVTGSPEALAGSYRASFFIELGLADSAALFGLAGVFIGDSLWIYLLGLAFGLPGMWMTAPTRLDIERRQREITAAGSSLSLLDALTTVPPPQRGMKWRRAC